MTLGCGDNLAQQPGVDAGSEGARLEIVAPGGDSLGLTFAQRATLAVRYTVGEDPVAGAEVAFTLLAPPAESTGGAALSALTAKTGADGIATVDLVAGAERANFRVEAHAPSAKSAIFYVAVAEGGFTTLRATPLHDGPRATAIFDRVEVRLYRAAILDCAALDIDAPPPSIYPPRRLAGFGGEVTFANVAASESATLVAWASPEGGERAIAAGCVDLAASAIRPGRAVSVLMTVGDRPLSLAPASLISTLELSAVANGLAAAGKSAAWDALACPAGPGQILLDCALDAIADDGALDCRATGSGPLVDAMAAHRGALDDMGCRALTTAAGDASLEALITDAIAAGGTFPVGDPLAALIAVRENILSTATITSSLDVSGPAATHTLATLAPGTGGLVIDLVASPRPVIAQTQVPVTITGQALAIGEHGFSLRYGDAARAAFEADALMPANLEGAAASLGTALASAAKDAQSETAGCAAVSAVACGVAGEALDCLEAACQTGAARLDIELHGWLEMLDSSGIDLAWSGAAPIADADFDLMVDPIGGGLGAGAGAWSARMTLADDQSFSISGAFKSVP